MAEKRAFSLTEAASILGLHRNTLKKWIDEGCPVVSRADRDRGVEWEIAPADVLDWRVRRSVDDAVAAIQDGAGNVSVAEANRRKAVANAILAEIEADQALRSVVRIADVLDAVVSEYAGLRSNLGNVGAKVAGRAATMTSAPAIQELVDDEIRLSLEALQYDQVLSADAAPAEPVRDA
jgi:phage terminase Nu1 subunit (DNA packaging protein)